MHTCTYREMTQFRYRVPYVAPALSSSLHPSLSQRLFTTETPASTVSGVIDLVQSDQFFLKIGASLQSTAGEEELVPERLYNKVNIKASI